SDVLLIISYFGFTKITPTETLPIVTSVFNILLVCILYYQRKFSKLENIEYWIIGTDTVIIGIWALLSFYSPFAQWYNNVCGNHLNFDATRFVHLLLQLSAWVSFAPIIYAVWKNPRSEHPGPWIIWTIAYGCWFIAKCIECNDNPSMDR